MAKIIVVVRHDGEGPEFSSGVVLGSGARDRRVSPDAQVRGLATHQACSFLADATTFAREQVDAAFHL